MKCSMVCFCSLLLIVLNCLIVSAVVVLAPLCFNSAGRYSSSFEVPFPRVPLVAFCGSLLFGS